MPSLPTPPLLPPLMMPLMPPQRVLQSPQENCIFFYSKVDAWSCRVLCDRLRELDRRRPRLPHIMIRIQSRGGFVSHALLVVDTIKQMSTPVHTHVDGFAASAATLISIAGANGHRSIYQHSTMLIHEPRVQQQKGVISTSSSIQLMNDNMQAVDGRLKELYEMHTRLRGRALDTELKRDTQLEASTCLAYGLVDHVIENTDATPYFTDRLISDEVHHATVMQLNSK